MEGRLEVALDGKEDQKGDIGGEKLCETVFSGTCPCILAHTACNFNLLVILYLEYLYSSCIGSCICIALYLYLHHHIPVSASLHTLLVIFNLSLTLY